MRISIYCDETNDLNLQYKIMYIFKITVFVHLGNLSCHYLGKLKMTQFKVNKSIEHQ